MIAHTVELNEYILNGDYVKDINAKNKLGTGGTMINAYAKLLE